MLLWLRRFYNNIPFYQHVCSNIMFSIWWKYAPKQLKYMNSNKLFMVQLVLMVCALFLTTSIIFYFEISSMEHHFDDDLRFDRNAMMETFKKVSEAQGGEQLDVGQVFACRDGSNKHAVMNDDYCDCADGLDEPLSSACSHILVARPRFSCGGNERDKLIYVSRLNDGICDCKDGSDEWLREADYCKLPMSTRKFLRGYNHIHRRSLANSEIEHSRVNLGHSSDDLRGIGSFYFIPWAQSRQREIYSVQLCALVLLMLLICNLDLLRRGRRIIENQRVSNVISAKYQK